MEKPGGWDESGRTDGTAVELWSLSPLAPASVRQELPWDCCREEGAFYYLCVLSPACCITCNHHTDTTAHPRGPNGFFPS